MSAVDAMTGSRLSMRNKARHILETIDEMSGPDVAASGWLPSEIDYLEGLAGMHIVGVPFGNWPPE